MVNGEGISALVGDPFVGVLLLSLSALALALCWRLLRASPRRDAMVARSHAVLEGIEEAIAIADGATGRILDANPALLRSTGYRTGDLEDQPLDKVFVDYDRLCDLARETPRGTVAAFGECRIRARDGRMIDADVTLGEVTHGGTRLLCLVARDITLRKQAERQREEHRRSLEHLANHDPLTGLPNRLALKAQLPQLLQDLTASQGQMALFYIDLDAFKGINDGMGHAAGDELLRITAQRLRSCVSARDSVIRMGGDEFVIIARDLPGRRAAAGIAERIVASLSQPLQVEGEALRVTASVGISLYPEDGMDLESLLKHADIALYEAKNAGRDNFRFFDSDMDIGHGERLALQQALRHAIGTDQIFLEYQPVLDLHTGQMISLEAMVRWRHPELGVLSPGRFIPLAEQCGLMLPLGEQIIELACRQLAAWQAAGVTPRPVALNLSAQQLAQDGLVAMITGLAERSGIALALLQLEVTETAVMQDAGRHVAALEALRGLGCKIFIDDFGTGYSSVSQLKNLPIDRIKIDGSFVRDMPVDANDAAIVGAVVSMARSLGIEFAAEGIESAEQLGMLRDLGCGIGQGFHFSRPIAASQCVALLEQAARNARLSDSLKIRQLRAAAGQGG
jgi:diguanylate cyclase (GGDEF)-like protein/PAS domain S-box-containing protein